MRVTCQSFDDLIYCLQKIQDDPAQHLFQNTLRVSTERIQINEATTEFILSVSAVVQNEGVEYLLSFAEVIGRDVIGGELEGSWLNDRRRNDLLQFADWVILPGIIGE